MFLKSNHYHFHKDSFKSIKRISTTSTTTKRNPTAQQLKKQALTSARGKHLLLLPYKYEKGDNINQKRHFKVIALSVS